MFLKAVERSVAASLASGLGGSPLSIFEQEWWLEAASLGSIERLETRWDNVVVGSAWYCPVRRGFLKKAVPPPYTRILPPRLTPPPSGPSVDLRNKVRIIKDLFAPLENYDLYHTVIRQPSDLVFALHLNAFTVSTKFTFVSEASTSLDEVHAGMHQKTRNLVKTGRTLSAIEFHSDFERFQKLSSVRLRPDHTEYQALSTIWSAVERRGAGTIVSAVGPSGHDLASVILVWDHERVYFLASARGGTLEANKAYALMFFESIALAKRMSRTFDADGFATVDSARALMKWGLPVSMNLNVDRGSLSYNTMKPLKEKFRPSPF